MLADIAQKIERAHAAEPVIVVGHDRRVRTVETEERRDLSTDVLNPAGDDFGRIQLALGRFETRIADHAGCAADQRNRLMSRLLEALQHQHRHQMSEMQTIRRRVEPTIQPDR